MSNNHLDEHQHLESDPVGVVSPLSAPSIRLLSNPSVKRIENEKQSFSIDYIMAIQNIHKQQKQVNVSLQNKNLKSSLNSSQSSFEKINQTHLEKQLFSHKNKASPASKGRKRSHQRTSSMRFSDAETQVLEQQYNNAQIEEQGSSNLLIVSENTYLSPRRVSQTEPRKSKKIRVSASKSRHIAKNQYLSPVQRKYAKRTELYMHGRKTMGNPLFHFWLLNINMLKYYKISV